MSKNLILLSFGLALVLDNSVWAAMDEGLEPLAVKTWRQKLVETKDHIHAKVKGVPNWAWATAAVTTTMAVGFYVLNKKIEESATIDSDKVSLNMNALELVEKMVNEDTGKEAWDTLLTVATEKRYDLVVSTLVTGVTGPIEKSLAKVENLDDSREWKSSKKDCLYYYTQGTKAAAALKHPTKLKEYGTKALEILEIFFNRNTTLLEKEVEALQNYNDIDKAYAKEREQEARERNMTEDDILSENYPSRLKSKENFSLLFLREKSALETKVKDIEKSLGSLAKKKQDLCALLNS